MATRRPTSAKEVLSSHVIINAAAESAKDLPDCLPVTTGLQQQLALSLIQSYRLQQHSQLSLIQSCESQQRFVSRLALI